MQIAAPRQLCVTKEQLSAAAQLIIDDEGEGVILQKPDSTYQRGRSASLLKLKVSKRYNTSKGIVDVQGSPR